MPVASHFKLEARHYVWRENMLEYWNVLTPAGLHVAANTKGCL
eukprot:CAMPEP_0204178320 /NCGR_PEP_ID=MMETSP0361-20130328/49207_1 /ASSEMBLY_ACC=CAM_ASM_000343 /TAXON_ID=268821 /ORGANISM="Scrippsiella Hangoei, Strain SHTV-5" /LENGTH=42 /DNA_ID= /DNA_START= /DNA_END= /DNA_ORIENTATION=